MKTITLAATAIGFAFLLHGSARSQAPSDAATALFVRDYKAKLPLLMERYSTNRKIRYRLIRYVVDPGKGERTGDERASGVNELITDGTQMKVVTLESKPERFKGIVQFWRPDMIFDISRNGGKFEIKEQRLASSSYYEHESFRYNFFAHEPMRAADTSGTTLWFDERVRTTVVVTVLEARPATYAGRACVEVRSKWDNNHGMVELSSTYLDPAMDYATIASENDWKNNSPQGAYKTYREVEYGPSADGFPVPKRSRGYAKYKDGTIQKAHDVEFLSYERYVPSADDFKLEKEYGLVTPAFVPTATSIGLAPASRRWWPWVVLAVGAVLAVVTVAVARRSRRRVAGPVADTPDSAVKTPSR
jgi:hypothetical protein